MIKPNTYYRAPDGRCVIFVGRVEEFYDRAVSAVELLDYASDGSVSFVSQGLGVFHFAHEVTRIMQLHEITREEFLSEWHRLTAPTFESLLNHEEPVVMLNFRRLLRYDPDVHRTQDDFDALVRAERKLREDDIRCEFVSACECGGEKARTGHSTWCPARSDG